MLSAWLEGLLLSSPKVINLTQSIVLINFSLPGKSYDSKCL